MSDPYQTGVARPPSAGYPVGGYSGVYHPTAPAPVPPVRRRRRTWVTILLAIVGLLAYALVRGVMSVAVRDAVGGGSGGAAQVNAAAVSHAGDLRQLLVPAPAGSQAWARPLGTAEQLTADQEAALTDDPKGRADSLWRYHFTRGAVRCWTENGTGFAVVLLQFDNSRDAADFTAGDRRNTASGRDSRTGTPTGVPDGLRIVDRSVDKNGYVDGFVFAQRGDVEIMVMANQVPPGQPDRLDAVARQQYDRL